MNIKSILIFFFCCSLVIAKAQKPAPDREKGDVRTQRDTSRNSTLQNIFTPPDSLKISVYHAQNPTRIYAYPDTMLGHYFQQSEPARKKVIDYVHLGSMGTPSRPLLFEVQERKGLDLGFHQFDLHKRDVDSVRYFKVNRTFTETGYAQNHTKDDFIFKGVFTRDLSENLNFSADYDRISHRGIYTNQRSRHTAFTINTAYENKKGNYESYASYTYNDFQQSDNGGVTSAANFNDPFYSDRENIPIYLKTAQTRMQEQNFSYTHYFDFLSKTKDSLATNTNKRHLTFGHQFVYSPGSYKFYDTSPASDSIFYQDLQVDNRGLRHYLKWNELENTFKLSTFKSNKEGTRPKDLFTVGLTHIYQSINQEPVDTSNNSLFLLGEWEYNPAKFLELNAYTHYGIGNNANEYLIKGNLTFNVGKLGQLKGTILNQRFAPSLVQSQMYISKRELYDNNFVKPITTSIKASYHLPVSKTTASVQYHILNNHIYYDTSAYAQQSASTISLLQLVLQQNFRFGAFGLDNTVAFQTDNSDVLRIPTIAMKNSIYLEGNVFKRVMFARIGFDFRMNTSYFADAYQPLTGQFHLQDDTEVKLYPALDLFLSFKVQTFRAFAKMENITGWFTQNQYYLTPGHPLADPHFKFGVSWRFID